jgi:hypothetical protein
MISDSFIEEDEDKSDDSSLNDLTVNEIEKCKEGMELFKIYKKRQHCSTRFYKLDLVQHRLVASTKDLRLIGKEGAKYCNLTFFLTQFNKSYLDSLFDIRSVKSNNFDELKSKNLMKKMRNYNIDPVSKS